MREPVLQSKTLMPPPRTVSSEMAMPFRKTGSEDVSFNREMNRKEGRDDEVFDTDNR